MPYNFIDQSYPTKQNLTVKTTLTFGKMASVTLGELGNELSNLTFIVLNTQRSCEFISKD